MQIVSDSQFEYTTYRNELHIIHVLLGKVP